MQRVWVLGIINVIFLYLLTVLNTLSIVIDDIIPFGSRKRQNFQDINFQTLSNKKFSGRGKKNRVGRVTVNTHFWPNQLFGF